MRFFPQGDRILIVRQVLEARIPGTETTIAQHPREELGSGAKVTTANGEVQSGAQAAQSTQQQADRALAAGQVSTF